MPRINKNNCTPEEKAIYNEYYRNYNKTRYHLDDTYKEVQKQKSRLSYLKKKELKLNLNIVNQDVNQDIN